MRNILLVIISFFSCVQFLFAESDTTYGRIRIKEKKRSSGGSSSSGSESGSFAGEFFGSCMRSCVSGVFDGCLDALFNNSGETATGYNGDQSDNDYQRKKKTAVVQKVEPCGYSSSPFHFSAGLGMGGIVYSKGITAGFVPGGNARFTWFPDTLFGVRLALEPTAAFDNILVDMEKDVFVDGVMVGTAVFSGESGHEFILPLTAQILFVPPTPSRAMFLAFGGGACYKREVTRGKQLLSGIVTERKITFEQWCPAFHFGLGFFMPLHPIFGIFEFSYTIMANDNSQRFETPGDNARYGHMPGISFSISTP